MELERRFLKITEIRAAGVEGKKQLHGYAAVFNRSTSLFGGKFEERIKAGAFARSLKEFDVRALWNHNDDFPLGRMSAGTLRLKEDEKGLAFEIDLPETRAGVDAGISVARGDVTGMSFGFSVPENGDEWRMADGKTTRTLIDVDLLEVSPVTFPAFESTVAEARSAEHVYKAFEQRIDEAKNSEKRKLERLAQLTRLAELS